MANPGQEGNIHVSATESSTPQVPLEEIPAEVLAEWNSRTGFAAAIPPENPAYRYAFREFTERRREGDTGTTDSPHPQMNPPVGGGLIPVQKILNEWLAGGEITPGNVVVYTAFLEANKHLFPQAQQALAAYYQRLNPNTPPISKDQVQAGIAGVLRFERLRPLLLVGNVQYENSVSIQNLTPTASNAIAALDCVAASQVWSIASCHYEQDGTIPARETFLRELQQQVRELRLGPQQFAECERLLDVCLGPPAAEANEAAARDAAIWMLNAILYIHPMVIIADLYRREGEWIADAAERAEALRRTLADFQTENAWPTPEPLDGSPMPAFPTEALPPSLRDWVQAEATATQTPADLPAMLAVANCAAALAKRVEVRIRDGWVEPVNIFTVTALDSGNRKSAVFSDATQPTRQVEEEEARRRQPAASGYENERQILGERQKLLQRQAARESEAETRAQLVREINSISEQLNGLRQVFLPRLIADDATTESLEVLLQQQQGRMMVAAPEGGVFGMMAGRYSDSPQLNVYLCGHAGDDLRTNRICRDSVYVHRPALTMALAVQPHVIQGLGRTQELRGQGLLARFLYAVPRSLVGHREISPPPVPAEVSQRYQRLVRELWDIGNRQSGVPQGDPGDGPVTHTIEFSPEALEAFEDFVREIEPRLGVCGDLAAIRDWGSKLAGAVARITGTLHVVTQAEEHWRRLEEEREQRIADRQRPPRFTPWEAPISRQTVEAAITIGRYLIEHAKVAFGMMGAADMPAVSRIADARYAVRWVIDGRRTTFHKRDLYKSDKSRFRRAEDADPVIELLIDRNIIRRTDEAPDPLTRNRGGRPPEKYAVNPRVFQGYLVTGAEDG